MIVLLANISIGVKWLLVLLVLTFAKGMILYQWWISFIILLEIILPWVGNVFPY
jgi:hypothetical protein